MASAIENADKKSAVRVMTFDDISKLAAKNERPESGMTYVDYLAWYVLRDIYRDYKAGRIDKERGESRKRDALDLWERETAKISSIRDQVFEVAELWKRIESAANAYQLNRTVENADKLIFAIYRMHPNTQESADKNGGDHTDGMEKHME